MSDPLWVDDITILINSNKFVEFFPTTQMSRAENECYYTFCYICFYYYVSLQ